MRRRPTPRARSVWRALAPIAAILFVIAAIAFAAPRGASAGDKNQAPCFGGEPRITLANQSEPQELVVADGKLYWWGNGLRRLDTKTMNVAPVDDVFHGPIIDVGPIDARDVFARSGQDDIVAFDLRTRRLRTLLPGHLEAEGSFPHVADFPAVDRRYLFFTQEGAGITSTGRGFFRVSRTGAARPEWLGGEPYANNSFVVDGGFVYYFSRGAAGTNVTVVRRALKSGAQPKVLAVLDTTNRRWKYLPRMTVAGGRVYFPYDWAIWSVAVNGEAPPVRRVELGQDGAVDLLVHGRCLYWANERSLKRIAIDGGAPSKPEVIADERHYRIAASSQRFVRVLATDGRFLYWPDVGGDRIMRAAPNPLPVTPAPVPVAMVAGAGAALVDSLPPPGAFWMPECRIHRDCATPAASPPACDADGGAAEPWSHLETRASMLMGQPVRVEGPLILGEWLRGRGSKHVPNQRMMDITERCAPGECCRQDPRPLAIGGGERELQLESFECTGDDSRMCCNAPAFAQRVIASGILQQRGPRAAWTLSAPKLCVVPAR